MNIFITGGSGFIGQATVAALTAAGHDVRALARSDAAEKTVRGAGATPVSGDMTNLDVLRHAASESDAVIHLGVARTADTADIDRAAAAALQDGSAERPYIHTGGIWVYGNTDGIVTEDAPLSPPAVAAWRPANEKLVLGRAEHGGHPVIVMPGVVYGHHAGLLENVFVAPARETRSVAYIGDGTNHCSLVHVDDIADLYLRALNAPAGSIYAGANGQFLQFRQIAEAISTGAGFGGAVHSISKATARETMGRLAEPFALDQRISSQKAQGELGWEPKHTDALQELSAGD
jgi:nucleoside-diphosphate-sugar epimerase